MAFARRTDTTHAPIRDALRTVYGEVCVWDTHAFGSDFPDLVLGVRGRTILIEVKTNQNRARGVRYRKSATNAAQEARRAAWLGDAWLVVHDVPGALAAVGHVLSQWGT